MKKIVSISLLALAAWSCGPNPYKTFESKNPAEDATVELENNNPQGAIDILTKALEDDPGNEQYISILALAYAQRAGVDPLSLAQNMASTSSSSTLTAGQGNGITALFSVMPVATLATIADVDTAVNLLLSIPIANLKTHDILKLAMFETAAMTLRAKILDTDGDGTLSTAELLAMTPDQALSMLNQLAGAANAFGGNNSTSSTDKAAAQQVAKIQESIKAEAGSTDEEKLKNYLARSSG